MSKNYYYNYNSLDTMANSLRIFFFKFLLTDKLYFLTFTFPKTTLTDFEKSKFFENYLNKLLFLDFKNHNSKFDFFWICEYGDNNCNLHFHMISNIKSFKGNYFFMSKHWNKFLSIHFYDSPSVRINIIDQHNLVPYINYILKDYEKGFNSNLTKSYNHYGVSNNLHDYLTSNNSLLEELIKQRFDTVSKSITINKINKNLGFLN